MDKALEKDEYIEEDRDGDVFFEIVCRGPQKCGSFVSYSDIEHCPKCRSKKILRRVVRKKVKVPQQESDEGEKEVEE